MQQKQFLLFSNLLLSEITSFLKNYGPSKPLLTYSTSTNPHFPAFLQFLGINSGEKQKIFQGDFYSLPELIGSTLYFFHSLENFSTSGWGYYLNSKKNEAHMITKIEIKMNWQKLTLSVKAFQVFTNKYRTI